MATKVTNKEADNTKVVRTNSDNWKFPKIPVRELYQKQPFTFFPKCTIKDSERPITVVSDNLASLDLLPLSLVRRFTKKKHKFVHLGLVQVAINPLERDGLDGPVTVCLRDGRQRNFKDSSLAVVETNMSQGPFYFNCFPSFSIPIADIGFDKTILNLRIKSTGMPLALTVRVVCKAMVDLNAKYLKEPVFGNTTYFHATSVAPATTLWDEVKLVDEVAIRARELQNRRTRRFQEVVSFVSTRPSSGD